MRSVALPYSSILVKGYVKKDLYEKPLQAKRSILRDASSSAKVEEG
jgi:hypothetical protein